MAAVSFDLESTVVSRRSSVRRHRVRVKASFYGMAVFELEGGMALKLSTLQARFPNACGLKYFRAEESGYVLRSLDQSNGMIYPPAQGWEDHSVYQCVFQESGNTQRLSRDVQVTQVEPKSRSLIVLGIDQAITQGDLREYFQQFGELVEATLCHRTGVARNYGFIKFVNHQPEVVVLQQRRHDINGSYRPCDVKVYESKIAYIDSGVTSCKVSVSGIPGSATKHRLVEYFSRYGDVTNVVVINPAWAFVTFTHVAVASNVCRQRHVLDGVQMRVVMAKRDFNTVPTRIEGKKPEFQDTVTYLPALPTLVPNNGPHLVEQSIAFKPQYTQWDVSHQMPRYSRFVPQGRSSEPSGTPQSLR